MERDLVFVTEPSTRRLGAHLRFWVRNEHFRQERAAGGRSRRRLVEVDCRSFSWAQLDSAAYAQNDPKGPVVASGETSPWRDVADADITAAMVFACMARG